MLEVNELRKQFGNLSVLDGVTFSVAKGEVLGVLGRSGSGKSTLLRCINFLEEFSAGEILLDGTQIGYERDANGRRRRRSEAEIARTRLDVGMVFQSYNLFPHLNVLDNVTLAPIHIKGVPAREAEELALELLAKVGLSGKTREYPSRLSGGQQQRVAIARALAIQPKVMLFDEVTSALDPELVGEVLRVMRQLAIDGMTMLIVTHELHFARDVANRLIFLDRGKIVEQGAPAALLEHPQTDTLKAFIRRFTEEYYL